MPSPFTCINSTDRKNRNKTKYETHNLRVFIDKPMMVSGSIAGCWAST
jgi:hypothetical protein